MEMAGEEIHLVSAVCLSILSLITVISNALLLFAIWKDPLRCFHAPTISFIVGISVADFVTALTTEPFFAAYYYAVYFRGIDLEDVLHKLFRAGSIISTVAISYSFLIVLALSWSQYIAMKYPHNFKRIVTRRNTITFNIASLLYLLCFTALQFTGMNEYTFYKVNLAVNSSFMSLNLVVILVLLNSAFRQRVNLGHSSRALQSCRSQNGERKTRRDNLKQQFTVVAMYLAAILLLSALPHVIIAQVFLYSPTLSPQARETFVVALKVSDLLLFVKVCMDTAVFAWRLPSYRQTVKMLLFRRSQSVETDA